MEQVTTKQIETRVKRQVVVTEDGQVVDDSGPQVTTNTTEDTETKKEEHTEVNMLIEYPHIQRQNVKTVCVVEDSSCADFLVGSEP